MKKLQATKKVLLKIGKVLGFIIPYLILLVIAVTAANKVEAMVGGWKGDVANFITYFTIITIAFAVFGLLHNKVTKGKWEVKAACTEAINALKGMLIILFKLLIVVGVIIGSIFLGVKVFVAGGILVLLLSILIVIALSILVVALIILLAVW